MPGLPFVDDSNIPLDDPRLIEAVGRRESTRSWGRWDGPAGSRVMEGEWWAFTTDQDNPEVAWSVRYHPKHGRTVLVVRDGAASRLHSQWNEPGGPLLFRSGGYWWDGTTWFRPPQVYDAAGEKFIRRAVRSAVTVTAADMLADAANPGHAAVLSVADLDGDAAPVLNWIDHLALWAARRPEDARALSACVVSVSAPELAGDQLIGMTEIAEMAGIAASTLRAYQSRGEAELPDPQAIIGGRPAWSKPVAADWVEARERSSEGVTEAMTAAGERLPVGAAAVRERYGAAFFERLWSPLRPRRWSLRQRDEDSIRRLADELAWVVADDLDNLIPTESLGATLRHAVLDEFATTLEMVTEPDGTRQPYPIIGLNWQVAKMLDWLIRHHPSMAAHTISEIIGEAERRLDVPRRSSSRALRTALAMDGELPEQAYAEFFDRTLPPGHDTVNPSPVP
ncbi:helix-turn-helix transcriptional regulator [Nocardia takedensis]|uniref:helix-turn-helix transcriptional regulator n=1 Tax=Nocardia takedensis TaxID=259390 RepID=UPI003F765590